MKVVLATEGTYPFHGGGVSVWCDQLVRGLPEHQFQVVAILGNDTETQLWPSPPNLERVSRVPIWGAPPAPKRASQQASKRFQQAHGLFVRTLLEPDAPDAAERFLEALRALFGYAGEANLSAALLSNAALAQLSEAWRAASKTGSLGRSAEVGFTFADALTATDLIEHCLRPLSFRPPRADLFHAVSNGLAALVGLAGAWSHGAPFVLSEHGLYLRERYLSALNGPGTYPVKTLLLNFFRLLSAASYRAADLIQPGSNYNQRWELRGGAAPERIRTIYNGVSVGDFPTAAQEPERPTLAWLGRIDPLKDLHTLLRAFALVREELPEARLRLFGGVAAGNEGYLESCQALLRGLELVGAATFEGRVAQPVEAYHAAHVVVLSSISEGFPYTLIEAMASGKATVSTDVGGVSEAVGDAGLVVAPRDSRSMAAASLRLLRDPAERRDFGSRARARILERFTLDQSLSAYRTAYAELSGRSPQAAQLEPSRAPRAFLPRWQSA